MKVIVGLGNPGPDYDDTRHNVGWWMLDRLAYDWGLDTFEKDGRALVTGGTVDGVPVRLMKPTTYMNRSGSALVPLRELDDFDVTSDLLVVVDDAALEAGRIRFRPSGSAGGHNGLRSVAAALGSEDYARLRIGVGVRPSGVDMADWVLSPMAPQDEDLVLEGIVTLVEGVRVWMTEGIERAMDGFNG